jgi:hypothetical protein
MSDSKSQKSKRAKKDSSDVEDDEDDENDLYIPDPKNASKLVHIVPSKEPKIKKYLSMTKPELQKWLRHNGQLVTGRKQDLLLRCIDGEINGRIPGCPACHKGQMYYNYSEGAYVCNGYWDELSHNPIRCGNIESHVKREKWRDIEKDSPIDKGEGVNTSDDKSGAHDEEHHHKDHPDHHHAGHRCEVEANHPLVDLLEDMAYYHSIQRGENWGYRSRAFISAARAVEHLPFEIDGKVHDALSMGDRRDSKHHVAQIGKSSAEVMQAFLDSGNTRSPHLEELKSSIKASDSSKEKAKD